MLYVLSQAKPKLKKAILTHCDDNVIRMLDEVVHNVLKGNIQLPTADLKKLQKDKKSLRGLYSKCRKTKCIKAKRRLFTNQVGGWANLLAMAARVIVPMLVEKAGEFVKDKFFPDNNSNN